MKQKEKSEGWWENKIELDIKDFWDINSIYS